MSTPQPLGCVRRGRHWHCHTAADLLALLGGPSSTQFLIDLAPNVPGELVRELADRGVTVTVSGGRIFTTGSLSKAVKRGLRLCRPALLGFAAVNGGSRPGRGDA